MSRDGRYAEVAWSISSAMSALATSSDTGGNLTEVESEWRRCYQVEKWRWFTAIYTGTTDQ